MYASCRAPYTADIYEGRLYRCCFFRKSEPVFVDLLMNPGIDSQPGGPVRHSDLSYRPARLLRLSESIPGLYKRLKIRALYFKTGYVTLRLVLSPAQAP
jgi:hypothetical protein